MTEQIMEHKEIARKTAIEIFPDPKTAIMLTIQNPGATNVPLVKIGDFVTAGQKIADTKERISAPVHSPISGKISKFGDTYNSCYQECSEAIYIENDGKMLKDKTLQPISESEFKNISNDALIKRIREAGIIGMGGAGFPTHIKLSPPADKPIKRLVVNAMEGEPYDTADERLLIENTSNILKGVKVIRKILGSPEVVIATKSNKTEAVEKLKQVFSGEPNTRIVAGHFTYQQGDAAQLQKLLFGYSANPDKRSYESGTIVHNVATINAIAKAVFEGEPLISRVTTLTGDIKEPKNILVKIGTPISDILNYYKIDTNDIQKVVIGGIMMGTALPSFDAPVTKRTSSIIVFSKSNYKPAKKRTACIRCSRCISACPVHLYPILINQALEKGDIPAAEKLYYKDCIACGTCSYVCPAGIPLSGTICADRR